MLQHTLMVSLCLGPSSSNSTYHLLYRYAKRFRLQDSGRCFGTWLPWNASQFDRGSRQDIPRRCDGRFALPHRCLQRDLSTIQAPERHHWRCLLHIDSKASPLSGFVEGQNMVLPRYLLPRFASPRNNPCYRYLGNLLWVGFSRSCGFYQDVLRFIHRETRSQCSQYCCPPRQVAAVQQPELATP